MTRNLSEPRLEAEIQDAIRLELGNVEKYPELTLWRNNVGVLKDSESDRFVRFGVGGKGGADLIGIFAGRFVAAEIKTRTGKQTEEQVQFQSLVEKKGGSYAVLRCVDDARAWIQKLRGES